MELYDTLLNKWIEFGGGSRPGTNKLRFQDKGENIILQIRYVFDWSTGEIVDLSFTLTEYEFGELVGGLVDQGFASLNKIDDIQELSFDWHLKEGQIAFRLKGYGYSLSEGRVGYQQTNFMTLIIDGMVSS